MSTRGKRPLDPHQRKALAFVRSMGGCAGLFMAPGTGKTLTAIRRGLLFDGAKLIICRRDDYYTWRQELQADMENSTLEIEAGGQSLPSPDDVPSWVMVTYDLVKNERITRWIKQCSWAVCIIDESHSIKRYSAKRTKAVIRATRHIPQRLALTGTPITNEVMDVWSQCLFIDDGRLFGDNEWKFKNRYYQRSGPGWYVRRHAKDEISHKLKRIAFHVHEDDVLKLPRKRRVFKASKMTGAQRRMYEHVLDNWELELSDGSAIDIDHTIVQVAKLRQISSGFVYEPAPVDDEGKPTGPRTTRWMRSNKLKLLDDLINKDGEVSGKNKIVVGCAFTAEIEAILKTYGSRAVGFMGSMNAEERIKARQRFRDDESVRLFVSNVDMLTGMNELVVADTLVYFSNSRRVVSRQQADLRIRRRGSERHDLITYYDLITEDSIDEKVVKAIDSKVDIAASIMQAIKEGKSVRQALKNN